MLDLRYVVEHLDEVRASLARRGPDAGKSLEPIAALAERRNTVIARLQALREQKNEANSAMAKLDKASDAFKERRESLKRISDESKELETEQRETEAALDSVLLMLPNLPDPNVPDGLSSDDNVEVRRWGQEPKFEFTPKDHVELGTTLGMFDFERAAKLSGSRFSVLKGIGAKLERSLISFMLDLHTTEHGYLEIWPPALVTDESLRATGQLPKFEADLFKIAPDWQNHISAEVKKQLPHRELYLIPTAEVPLTNLHRNEIMEDLPVKYCAYTPCFRSEAGSAGKDTRGLIRQHQFDKVELVRFEQPDRAEAALEELTNHAEEVLKRLELHYRVVELCAGDLSNGARRCYDIEVYLPGQNAYREISSCSWFGDFQARRGQIRYRAKAGDKPQMAHTLNGSGLAVGRTMVAILEQYQQADGSVRVPDALVPYLGGIKVLRA
ncbi:MAG TPA: serine--tRNA ligase [Polyangiales bacterium]|nr:serine--tRNA ligase [Polyangiales bacterium]